MPQASDELRAKMVEYFGADCGDNFCTDGPPHQFLMTQGYVEKSGLYSHPDTTRVVDDKEFYSLLYLRDEWDCDFSPKLYEQMKK